MCPKRVERGVSNTTGHWDSTHGQRARDGLQRFATVSATAARAKAAAARHADSREADKQTDGMTGNAPPLAKAS